MLDRNITVETLYLNGGALSGSFDLTLNEGLAWSGGDIYLSGTINLAPGSISNISGFWLHGIIFSGPTVNNYGIVNQNVGITNQTDTGVIINNFAGATWNIQQGTEQGFFYLALGSNVVFNNWGNFVFFGLPSQYGGAADVEAAFNNTGSVTLVQNLGGSYAVAMGPGSASGNFNVAVNTELLLYSYVLTNGATISGAGSTSNVTTLDIEGHNTINTSLTNYGVLTVRSGATATLTGDFTQPLPGSNPLPVTQLSGGTINSYPPLSFEWGILGGCGTINSNVTLSDNAMLSFQILLGVIPLVLMAV